MDGPTTSEIYSMGYAIPAYSLYVPPYHYKFGDQYLQSSLAPTVRLPGVEYPVIPVGDIR